MHSFGYARSIATYAQQLADFPQFRQYKYAVVAAIIDTQQFIEFI